MSQTPIELKSFLAGNVTAAALAKKVQEESARKAIRQVAETMRELLADPHWEKFAQEVENLKAEAQAVLSRAERDLNEKYLAPNEYGIAKVLQARGRGGVDAYQSVLVLIRNLIEAGEKAEE